MLLCRLTVAVWTVTGVTVPSDSGSRTVTGVTVPSDSGSLDCDGCYCAV